MGLKPCPFCGGTPITIDRKGYGFFILCQECHVTTDVNRFLHLSEEAWNRRAIPPEPRTCETCGCGERMARSNEYECMVEDPDTLPNRSDPSKCVYWTPRYPQSADVETVREALNHGVAVYENLEKIGVDGSGKVLDLFKSALAALDRIAGKEGKI